MVTQYGNEKAGERFSGLRPLSIKKPVWFFDAMEEALRAPKILTDFRAAHGLLVLFLPPVCATVGRNTLPAHWSPEANEEERGFVDGLRSESASAVSGLFFMDSDLVPTGWDDLQHGVRCALIIPIQNSNHSSNQIFSHRTVSLSTLA